MAEWQGCGTKGMSVDREKCNERRYFLEASDELEIKT
jgi:hypothetical protein